MLRHLPIIAAVAFGALLAHCDNARAANERADDCLVLHQRMVDDIDAQARQRIAIMDGARWPWQSRPAPPLPTEPQSSIEWRTKCSPGDWRNYRNPR